MTQSNLNLAYPASAAQFAETTLGSTVKTVKASAGGTIYAIEVDNQQNVTPAFIKLYDAATAGAVTPGTTDPDWCFKIAGSTKGAIIPVGGVPFTNGLQVRCVTAGGTAGVTAMTNPPAMRIVYA